jgi:ABC-type branched-subunit amino acid transport system substrate-binding protein
MDRRKFTTLGAASAIALLGPRQLLAQGTQPLKIGIMNDLSSVYADFQGFGSKIAAELAVADYAAQASVAVEVVIADHQNKPDIGSGLARRWFDVDGVDVIMDLPNSAVALAVLGGKVLGAVRHPINTSDFSSFLLQAQSSGADVVAFANAGGDTNQSMKQAAEFGLAGKQRLAALVFDLTHVPPLGLAAVQGVKTIQAFYWDTNDTTRGFGKRFSAAHPKGDMPNHMHAGMYGATAHLIKAMAQTKSAADGIKLVDAMKAMPTDDPLFGKGQIRVDGRHIHPMYLFETKKPSESIGKWDVFKQLTTINPDDVWRPLDKGGCPFVKI